MSTSYDSGILRQYYGIVRDLPMNHTRFTGTLPERTKTGGPITASDQIVRAVHSCKSCFFILSKAIFFRQFCDFDANVMPYITERYHDGVMKNDTHTCFNMDFHALTFVRSRGSF